MPLEWKDSLVFPIAAITVMTFSLVVSPVQSRRSVLEKMPSTLASHTLPNWTRLFLRSSGRFSQRHALWRQPLKQGAGSLHVRGPKAFGETIVNRCKRCSRLVVATLAHPQTGNAQRNPQLPE